MKKLTYQVAGIAMITVPAMCSSALAENAISERIYFVQQDGEHALVYTTNRTEYGNSNLWFKAEVNYQPEDYLKDFLYLFPRSEEWSSESKPGYQVLNLPNGSFASLEWTDLQKNSRLQVDDDGQYHFRNWDGETTTPEGHFGLWNSPGNFEQIAYSWVFPDNLEPVAHTANREGEWVLRHNTITFYGNDVNNLSFDIHYRPVTGDAYDDLKDLQGAGIDVQQEASGIKVTLEETLLFPTGVAIISREGEAILKALAQKLRERPTLHVVVAGHTDNVPISPRLQSKYLTNWELASARSINIIHFLVDQGVAEPRFEAQAFSFIQPKASNNTAEGRASNRRIEVFLSETEQLSEAEQPAEADQLSETEQPPEGDGEFKSAENLR